MIAASTNVAVWRTFVLGTVLLVGACGFHPRGSLVALDDPGRLFLDTERGLTIEDGLRVALVERAFVLAPNRDDADIVLRISGEQQTQRIVSVRSTGRVSEFELGHGVTVGLSRNDPGTDSTDQSTDESSNAAVSQLADRVQVTREYTYDESQVLGKENEARILRGEMSEELVRQIVLRTVASLARDADVTPADGTPVNGTPADPPDSG